MTALEILGALSNAATAIGVGVAASQLFMARQQATTSFEDALTNQYRVIIERLPVEALFGEQLHPDTQAGLLPHFYRYFDLCNEQVFLRKKKRVTNKTWENWVDGIKSNMRRPAFAAAWVRSRVARTVTSNTFANSVHPRVSAPREATPNPSFERTCNGMPPWPRGAVVHVAPRGHGTMPSPAAQLKR